MRKPHSFDIFDTLIARRCVEPHNVFREIEARVNLAGFAAQRIRAEAMVAGGAYTLDDIYRTFGAQFGHSAEVTDYLKNAEIDAEVDNAIGIKANLESVEHGDVLITDMYLPRAAIMRILDKVGLRKQVGLVISSSGKHSGEVWGRLRDSLAIEQHVGDNAHSDVNSPMASGVYGEHITDSHLSTHENFLRNEGFELLARTVREARLTRLGSKLGRERTARKLLQYNCNIPILLLTSVILNMVSNKLGLSKILFSSRDCYYLSRIFRKLADGAHWTVDSEYFYTSRVSRIGGSPTYLKYFQDIADENSLVVDLCGTGWSLGELYQKAGVAPQTFLLHDLRSKPELRAAYDQVRPSSVNLNPLSLISDATIKNGCLEMLNYVDSGMTTDVKVVPGCFAAIPEFEYPNYPHNVLLSIDDIAEAQQDFLDIMGQGDIQALVREIETNFDKIEHVVSQLYKDLCNNMGSMHDIAVYHARQDRKSMWRLKNGA